MLDKKCRKYISDWLLINKEYLLVTDSVSHLKFVFYLVGWFI